jgi:hypothetical protein
MKFQRNDNNVKSFSGGFINKTGFYVCTIIKAYEAKSNKTLSEAINFEVVTDSGATGRFSIWVTNKDGSPDERNEAHVNDLMILLDMEEISSKPGKLMLYDYDLGCDTEQRKMVFNGLIDHQVGLILEKNGKYLNFCGFYDAETRQSAAEKLGDTDAVSWQRNLDYFTGDARIIKQSANQPTSPQNSAPVDPSAGFNDDMPF